MNRRSWIAGFVGTMALPSTSRAETKAPRLPDSLARTPKWLGFTPAPDGMILPDLVLLGDDGRSHRLRSLSGRPAILSLWSETCAPCLLEAPDLARLASSVPWNKLTILALLTSSSAKLDGVAARARLDRVGAAGLPTWAEPNGEMRLLTDLAESPNAPEGSIPCTLLVDKFGRVRARSFGGRFVSPSGRSLWASPKAALLIQAISAGALDQIEPPSRV